MGSVLALCTHRDYESLFGGYETMHEATTVAFDVDPVTNDLVVAGQVAINFAPNAIFYFVKEDTCSIQWVFYLALGNSDDRLEHVEFDPNLPGRIYALSSYGMGNTLYWIDNRLPHETKVLT